jgi:hypothetical protein
VASMGVKGRDMTQEATRNRTSFPDKARILTISSWHRIALAAVLMLSAFLNLFRITQEGYGNTYYAATVKNMLASWSNFFFVSYDAGFVSVEQTPSGALDPSCKRLAVRL